MRRVTLLVLFLLISVSAGAQSRTQNDISTANGVVQLDTAGAGGAGFQVSGTWTGTITFECAVDRGNYAALNVVPPNSSTSVTTTSSNGAFQSTVTGCAAVRARMSSFTSGTATVTIVSVPNATGPAAISVSSSGNAAAGATGGAVPGSADYQGINIAGNLTGQTGFSLGTARASATAIVDGSGNQITSFGGGTQYATGAAQATPTGTAALGWDGTNVRVLKTDASGNMLLGAFQATPLVNAAQSGTWNIRLQDTSGNGITSATRGSERALSMQLVDAAGAQITSFGGGTQFAAGSAQASNATGTLVLGYDGTNVRAITTASNGHPQMDCSNCSGSGASNTDNTAFVQSTNAESPAAGLASTNDAAYTTATNGRSTIWQMTTKGHGIANAWQFDGSGNALTSTSNAADVNIKSCTSGVCSLLLTEAATQTAAQANNAAVLSFDLAYDGSTYTRVRGRSGLISSGDFGYVTRPFLPSDGTNTQPAGDASARAIHVATDTGEVVPMASVTTTNATVGCNILSAASTNSTNCKGSSGNFYGYEIYNTTTTVYYLRLYNASSAPTCSSSTGFIRSIPIPPAASAGLVGGAVSNFALPVGTFTTGLGYCITAGSSSTDNTSAVTGIFGELRYK